MTYNINFPTSTETSFRINRFPKSANKSLRPNNTADQYLTHFINDNQLHTKATFIYNDSFGYLATHLNTSKTHFVVNLKSQTQAIENNLTYNKIEFENNQFINPLQKLDTQIDVGIIKIPKSMDLFELYLNHLCQHIDQNSIVVCGFMTRHFTKQMISIAEKYFDIVEQSKAWKKSRLIVLKNFNGNFKPTPIHSISSEFGLTQQYYGVFSAKNIDYASQFLMEHLSLPENTKSVLDLASGNGILAMAVQQKSPQTEIHLVDDSFLAVESSKLNLQGDNIHFHHQFNLDEFKDDSFDYIISNPPFHLEHEIDINLPLNLFSGAKRCLTKNGVFQLVANRHLNYKTHLSQLFSKVDITAENDKFVVYACQK